ncbi:MAG TPA: DUF4349 domain-containing protein [Terriglobales bacterium]|jgi:hypothetical protein|nr:DUF4349 domain-containing protein [Terriglobales bacterium]
MISDEALMAQFQGGSQEAPKLPLAVADLKTLGRVENESQSGEEVTSQHTDLVARLKNSRETEQRFRTILEQRSGNAVEILQVEQGIARVRGDIERMEAEQKALEHRIDFATVELQLSEEYKDQLQVVPPSTSTRLRNAAIEGYRNVANGVVSLVLFLLSTGPSLLLWGAVLFFPRAWLGRDCGVASLRKILSRPPRTCLPGPCALDHIVPAR